MPILCTLDVCEFCLLTPGPPRRPSTASAWNGLNATSGTCTLHAYNEAGEDEAEPRMGRSVDEFLNPNSDVFRDVLR